MTTSSSEARLHPFIPWGLMCIALVSCGEQEIRAIEPLPISSARPPEAPEPPEPPTLPIPGSPTLGDRGRVQVRDGNLLTDKGTRLRGVMYGFDNNAAGVHFDSSVFAELSGQTGLNAFHVYLENPTQAAGTNVAQADELVEMTSAAGMYLVIGVGGGPGGGSFNLEKIRAFWSFYAPRYAARTHVIYELQNIPDTGCDVAYKPETLAMEQEVYGLIRGFAPSTHVALFSFIAQPTAAALAADLDAVEGAVDWSKASVGLHTELCNGQDNLQALLAVTRARGIAAFASEMGFITSYDTTKQLETERVGWFSFEWFVRTRDLAAFRAGHTAAGVSWCPDFGKWPEDSETCSTP